MIIIEGMDNSGKSTLATKLGLEVIHPGPAPSTYEIEQGFLESQLRDARLPIVMDRVTCISQQVYQNKLFDQRYMDFLNRMLATPHCIVIYCRPPDKVILNLDTQEIKEYDTVESMAKLKANASNYIKSYDKLMSKIPHLLYNYTCTNDSLIQLAISTQFILGDWRKCQQSTTPKRG